MKKPIALLTICLPVFAGMATVQAQTKEATIAWIKERLERYTAMDTDTKTVDITVSPCQVSWKDIWYRDNSPRGSSIFRLYWCYHQQT